MALVSAAAFGSLSILAKLAYAAGLGTYQLLAFRFVLAAAGMLVLAALVNQSPLSLSRRQLATLFGLGAVIYTGQSLTYFTALRTLPASLCVLIVYAYPSLVVVAGWVFLRRAVSVWHGVALILSFAGLVLLVGGGRISMSWGLLFAMAAPLIYTAYILVGERAMASVPAIAASAVIMSGTAVAFCIFAAIDGQLSLPATSRGWAVGVGIALLPTMVAISFFMAALPRIGGARAALLSTLEPVITVILAVVLLGDRLSPPQVAGGVLVLAAVALVQVAHLWRPGAPAALK
ncbi:MAG TPA: DMT family transporter [Candidatus Dormibacteraeota bacterium]|jgi:drug/metabolite transporter (DMT)-like permease